MYTDKTMQQFKNDAKTRLSIYSDKR